MLKQYNGMVQIPPNNTVIKVKQFPLTFVDTQKDQFLKLQKLGVI
jgi:hypothetical protein